MAHLTHTTTSTKPKELTRKWHVVDAKDIVLGRLATSVASHLIGKLKSNYSPEADCGDFVIVLNSRQIKLTGNKADQKVYTRYSGYPGGLKNVLMAKAQQEKPNFVIRHAVMGMLPKNKLRKVCIKRLFIYDGETHPHQKEVLN